MCITSLFSLSILGYLNDWFIIESSTTTLKLWWSEMDMYNGKWRRPRWLKSNKGFYWPTNYEVFKMRSIEGNLCRRWPSKLKLNFLSNCQIYSNQIWNISSMGITNILKVKSYILDGSDQRVHPGCGPAEPSLFPLSFSCMRKLRGFKTGCSY